MKTLVTFDNCGSVIIDPETLDVTPINGSREAISRLYLLTEDLIVKTPEGKSINAQAGDIVIKFYDSDFPNRVVVVKSEEWKQNIESYNAEMEKAREMEKTQISDCVNCCDECKSC